MIQLIPLRVIPGWYYRNIVCLHWIVEVKKRSMVSKSVHSPSEVDITDAMMSKVVCHFDTLDPKTKFLSETAVQSKLMDVTITNNLDEDCLSVLFCTAGLYGDEKMRILRRGNWFRNLCRRPKVLQNQGQQLDPSEILLSGPWNINTMTTTVAKLALSIGHRIIFPGV